MQWFEVVALCIPSVLGIYVALKTISFKDKTFAERFPLPSDRVETREESLNDSIHNYLDNRHLHGNPDHVVVVEGPISDAQLAMLREGINPNVPARPVARDTEGNVIRHYTMRDGVRVLTGEFNLDGMVEIIKVDRDGVDVEPEPVTINHRKLEVL